MKSQHHILLVSLILLLTACGSGDATPTTNPATNPATFRVAMLLPRTIDADGWNRAGYEGLLLIQSELGAEIAYSESVPEAEFEQVFRQYAEAGYDFIIGHGAQFVDAAEVVAGEFPRSRFAVFAMYEGNNRNLGSLSLRFNEVSYLMGVVAALKTQTGHVAFISGAPNNTNEEIARVFELGAKATNPDIQVTLEWTGSWTDEESARTLTQNYIDTDVDVLLVVAGQVAPVVHHLADEAGIYTIGWTVDQYDIAPDSVLVSVVESIPSVLLQGAILVRRGRWEGKQYQFGIAENALYLTPFRDSLTAQQEAVVEEIKSKILSGEINTLP